MSLQHTLTLACSAAPPRSWRGDKGQGLSSASMAVAQWLCALMLSAHARSLLWLCPITAVALLQVPRADTSGWRRA